MKLAANNAFTALAVCLSLLIFLSCEEELTTLGEGVIAGEPFSTNQVEYDVFAYNKRIEAVQTNKLPLYQLGNYVDSIYGITEASITSQVTLPNLAGNPTFGVFSQASEDLAGNEGVTAIDENETVKEVVLYIPYQLEPPTSSDKDGDRVLVFDDADDEDPNSDTDGDGVTDIRESNIGSDPLDPASDGTEDGFVANGYPRTFALDSIYGDISKPFTLNVNTSTFFLRDLDPNQNFEQTQEYYSNQQFSPSFIGESLIVEEDAQIMVDNVEYFELTEDDPDTEENEQNIERQNPGIRVRLKPEFFQENVLDKEGSSELLSQSNFSEFFRGIHLSLDASDQILMLFNLTQANITITYEYDLVIADEDGNTTAERDVTLGLVQNLNAIGGGNAVNTILNPNFPDELIENMNENASRIYLKGGPGAFAEIKLFDEVDATDIINEIRANNWIINEANLEFYVDRATLAAANNPIEPKRLYLFNADTNLPIYNSFTDESEFNSALGSLPNYDGVLQTENDLGVKYTIRITEYLNDIIVRDAENVPLRLTVSSDVRDPRTQDAVTLGSDNTEYSPRIPIMSTINPFGTVLFGSDVENENLDKKLKLRLFYTEAN